MKTKVKHKSKKKKETNDKHRVKVLFPGSMDEFKTQEDVLKISTQTKNVRPITKVTT